MGLADIISAIRGASTGAERYELSVPLSVETASHDALGSLDQLSLDLKWDASRTSNEYLWGAAANVDAARAPFREQAPLLCYTIARERGRPYWQRLAEINNYLDTNIASHDDLRLTLRHLDDNSYLRRRRRTEERTGARDERRIAQEARLKQTAERQLRMHDIKAQTTQVGPSRAETYLLRTGLAVAGIALMFAGVPLPLYAALL